eukprot:550569_1
MYMQEHGIKINYTCIHTDEHKNAYGLCDMYVMGGVEESCERSHAGSGILCIKMCPSFVCGNVVAVILLTCGGGGTACLLYSSTDSFFLFCSRSTFNRLISSCNVSFCCFNCYTIVSEYIF